jgi:hypothetical protein
MALSFQTDRIDLQHVKGQKTSPGQTPFPKPVNTQPGVPGPQVVLRGFKLEFDKPGTPTKIMEVSIHNPQAAGNDVTYRVVTRLQDTTGQDEYSGFVDVLVIADVV